MKLTNEQLKQIIKEELNKVMKEMTRGEYEFQQSRERMADPFHHRIYGGDDQGNEYPQHADKLAAVYRTGPEGEIQAKELADALDVPIDLPMKGISADEDGSAYIDRSPPYKLKEVVGKYIKMFKEAGIEVTRNDFENEQNIKAYGRRHGKKEERILRKAMNDQQIKHKMINR